MATDPGALQILVVEDNDGLRQATVDFLNGHGHNACGVASAEDVDDTPQDALPDIYLIDVNLPGEDGFSLAERIRASQPLVGLILITARGRLADRVEGYSSGADVYLTKPTRAEELLAVLHNLSRRATPRRWPDGPQADGPWTLHSKSLRLLSPKGDILSLTRSECSLLQHLSDAAGACSYEKLIDAIGSSGLNDKADKARLEVLVSRLRTKLRHVNDPSMEIRTVHGKGYQMSEALRVQAL
jgi:DNA-binding response OmpR family regulator